MLLIILEIDMLDRYVRAYVLVYSMCRDILD